MKLVIRTQFKENYGAHDWDGTGECPQYWKFKGGSEYIIDDIDHHVKPSDEFLHKKLEMIIDGLRYRVENKDNYSEEYILNWSVEDNDYMSDFERSQLEYDGVITYPEPRLEI
jgi:hypothetical protein